MSTAAVAPKRKAKVFSETGSDTFVGFHSMRDNKRYACGPKNDAISRK